MTAIRIPFDSDSLFLDGELDIPKGATGIILFAHGSGSSRHSLSCKSPVFEFKLKLLFY
jgi:hypothetical protein